MTPQPSSSSRHFIVQAPDAETAEQVARWAESARQYILERWFAGQDEPWNRRVRIVVHAQHPGYFATEFTPGAVTITLWARDAHLESTVRHEVTHAVMHLRFPHGDIPRWLDEGIAVCNESAAEQQRLLAPLRQKESHFTIRQLAGMKEYPRDVLLFYAQSFSLTDFLVRRHGERAVIRFLEASFRQGQEPALQSVLGYHDFDELERQWRAANVEGGMRNGEPTLAVPRSPFQVPRSRAA